MFEFKVSKYIIRLLDNNNAKELKKVQELRYNHLLREFNPNLPEGGIDNDGNDINCDSILVIDSTKDLIVGSYRVATKKTLKSGKFLTQSEFNIDSIIDDDYEIVELGRAVVHREYRDGTVINLLWSAILQYCIDVKAKFMFGTFSFHGVDPTKYAKVLSYLKDKYIDPQYKLFATKDSFEFPSVTYDEKEVISSMPSLLKAYLMVASTTVSTNGFIDYDFKSCDIITLVNIASLDANKARFFLRRLQK